MRTDEADFILTGESTSARVAFREAMRSLGLRTPELTVPYTRNVDIPIPEEFKEEVEERVHGVLESLRAGRVYRGKDSINRMKKINPSHGIGSAVAAAWARNQVSLVMRNRLQNNARPTVKFIHTGENVPLLRTEFSIRSSHIKIKGLKARDIESAYRFADRRYIIDGNEFRAIALDLDGNTRRGMEGVRHGVDDTIMGSMLLFGFDNKTMEFRRGHAKVYVTCHRPPVVVYCRDIGVVPP
jgi:hypothetical protein